MSTLIIAEKNKAALAIAEALGPVKQIKKSKLSVYQVPTKNIFVIPLRGHILSYKNTPAFKSWSKSIPREIITNLKAIKKYPLNYAEPYIKALKEYGKICDEVIIATDADIEGCNIGLIDAFPFVKNVNPKIQVSQMWLSSLQKNEIIKKFKNTIAPKFSWAETGEARALIDAIIGFSATREITNSFKPLLQKINQNFISIGRVQTCLLYLIYIRDDRINNFIPESYFTIEANLLNSGLILKATHQSNPFKKEQQTEAQNIYQKIKDEKIAFIKNKSRNVVKRKPPTPLNTSKALVLLTRILKISANLALKTMNDLYLNKIISYPRTDSDVYKPDFNHIQYLEKFLTHSKFGKYDISLLNTNRIIPTKGKKDAGDHPPITPLESLELNSPRLENDLQRKVYDLLAKHYLALFGEDATEAKIALRLSIKEEPFNSKSVSLVSEGFLEIAPFLKPKYDPEIKVLGDTLPVKIIFFNSKETQPPPRYTDTTLLQLMERNNLGTKATRPNIIQILQNRNLINRNKRQYVITELGTFLIENLKDIWLPFLEPKFTAEIEDKLNDIKELRKSKNVVVKIVKENFLLLFDKFISNKNQLLSKMSKFETKNTSLNFQKSTEKKFPLTTSMCPFCKTHPMKLITTHKKKRFLACSNEECEKKYLSVPKKGRIYILTSKCSICDFNIFKINTRTNNKSFTYYICPNCWNKGFKDNSSIGFCSKCENYKIINNQCQQKEIIL